MEYDPRKNGPKLEDPVVNMIKLDIYMEAQCPDTSRFVFDVFNFKRHHFCSRFFRQQLKKAWHILGNLNRIELNVIPFGKARCTEKGNDFE